MIADVPLGPVMVWLTAAYNVFAFREYIRDTWAGRVRPSWVSWLIWTVTMGTAFAASLAAGAVAGLVVAGTMTIIPATVVAGIGWSAWQTRTGRRRSAPPEEAFPWQRRVELICGGGALGTLVLWAATSSPSVALIAIIGAATSDWFARNVAKLPSDTSSLWLAGATGAVGAFFSIAIGIRSRTVLTDLNMRDNIADSLLRILIGVIAATLLQCLLLAKAVHLAIGGVDLAPPAGGSPWTVVLLVGFVAGFSERLIPDLLARTTLDPAKAAAPAPAAPGVAAPAAGPKPAAIAVAPAAPASPAHEPDCLCDLKLSASAPPPHHALPSAKGGVALTPTG